jgi:hypothetical protein
MTTGDALPYTVADTAVLPWKNFEFPSMRQLARAQRIHVQVLREQGTAHFRSTTGPPLQRWVGAPVVVGADGKEEYQRLRKGNLYADKEGRIWVPDYDSLRMRIAVLAHLGQSGHVGTRAMLATIKRTYIWPRMHKVIKEIKDSCFACASQGKSRVPRPLGDVAHSTRPFEAIHADWLSLENVTVEDSFFTGDAFVGKYILLIRDDFSGFTRLYVCAKADSAHAVESILDWIACFSTPTWVCTDGGPHLVQGLMTDLMKRLESAHMITPVYASWSNGFIERAVGLVVETIKKLLAERQLQIADWKPLVALVQHRLNHTPSRVLGDRTPFEVATGQKSSTSLSLIATATPRERDGRIARTLEDLTQRQTTILDEYIPQIQEHLWSMHYVVESTRAKSRRDAQEEFAKRKGLNRRPPREINVGDWVLHMRYGGKLRNKLMTYWAGPKQVIE